MSDVIKDALKKRIKEHEGYKLDTYMDLKQEAMDIKC